MHDNRHWSCPENRSGFSLRKFQRQERTYSAYSASFPSRSPHRSLVNIFLAGCPPSFKPCTKGRDVRICFNSVSIWNRLRLSFRVVFYFCVSGAHILSSMELSASHFSDVSLPQGQLHPNYILTPKGRLCPQVWLHDLETPRDHSFLLFQLTTSDSKRGKHSWRAVRFLCHYVVSFFLPKNIGSYKSL